MSDWSDLTTRMPKLLHNLEAELTLHWWGRSRATCEEMISRLQGVIACSERMETEELKAKYERNGWQLYRLKDYDAVVKAGVCAYCGSKDGEHFEACAMWSAA